jgi:hypothetical protein
MLPHPTLCTGLIDAGDTFAFDAAGNANKTTRQRAAADRIFGLLPNVLARPPADARTGPGAHGPDSHRPACAVAFVLAETERLLASGDAITA